MIRTLNQVERKYQQKIGCLCPTQENVCSFNGKRQSLLAYRVEIVGSNPTGRRKTCAKEVHNGILEGDITKKSKTRNPVTVRRNE